MKVICNTKCYGFKEKFIEENQILDITKKDVEELRAKAIIQWFTPQDDEAINAFNPPKENKTIKK